jgi:RND superfamily putative drug exporter
VATLLYRLGDFSRRHSRLIVLAWLLILGLTTAGAVGLSQPMSSSFTIPGAGYQKVADTLKAQIPEASGGIGTVVLSSESGAFTAEQKQAVADAANKWSQLPGVREVRDPFVVQQQLADAAKQVSEGRAKLEASRAQLDAGEQRLATERKKLDAAQGLLDSQKALLRAGAPVPDQLTAAQKQLDEGRSILEAQAKKLQDARTQFTAGERQLVVGERQVERSKALRFISADGTVALTQVQFEGEAQSASPETRKSIQAIGTDLKEQGIRADFSTEIVQDVSSIIGPGEIIGVAVAAIVLIVVLGTLIAAGLPLVMSLVGVAVGIGATLALTSVIEMNSVTPALALMLGLAVGIDYALFILSRHRTQLLEGVPKGESIARATGTSGTAVLFAGLTVIIALAALVVTGIPFLGIMGLVGALTVALAVLVALTLTPAVLDLAGHRVVPKRLWRRYGFTDKGQALPGEEHFVDHEEDPQPPAANGWAERVTRHPWLFALASVVLLAVVALPTASLRLGLPDGSSEAPDSTAYRTYALTAKHFGEGANGPIVAVATLPAGLDELGAQERSLHVADLLAEVEGVTAVVPFGMSEDRRTAAFQIVPRQGPAEESTVATVKALRAASSEIAARPAVAGEQGSTVGFTGQTVANIDISQILADALPIYLAIVVGLSLLILVLVFRSLVVPLVATGGFLLSLAAAFGAVVAIYQWGWLGDYLGVNQPTAILSFLPTLLIGVLFGLAMDYQMFLVSGMREAHQHGQDARRAVVIGFHHGRVVVTAAALIMVSVFAGFVFSHMSMIRPIGFGLAFGVLADAFIVRMTLTPAVMHLLGERAWWLPRWLDRLLPDIDVEGASLARSLERKAQGPLEPAGRHTA